MPGQLLPQCELQTVICGTCGVVHAIPAVMYSTLKDEGGFWHCPNGHSRGWGKGTLRARIEAAEAELERERERKAAALSRANRAEQQLTRTEKTLQRERKRTAAGVCPCCHRTFVQLARHMKCKHPEHGQ